MDSTVAVYCRSFSCHPTCFTSQTLIAHPFWGQPATIFESPLANSVSGRFLFVCQEHAYPADELMPLSCQGRYRGTQPNRGDIDDALGK